jgi:hypothetical protein
MLLPMFVAIQAVEPASTLADSLKARPERCARQSSNGEDIVVCGRRLELSPYRIGPQPPSPPALPKAEFKIADGVEARLSAEQGEIGGIPTNRAMISLKIKF